MRQLEQEKHFARDTGVASGRDWNPRKPSPEAPPKPHVLPPGPADIERVLRLALRLPRVISCTQGRKRRSLSLGFSRVTFH